jgi:predicted transposase/invertase (TIGR01784 family)
MVEKNRIKSFEELRFSDDFMFGKVMEDLNLCREVLECLLGKPVGKLKEIQTQREFKYTSDGKPIRMDVYNEAEDGSVFDAEMEKLNHKTVESHMLPKRARFYQAAIDIDYMNKGDSYKILPESTVVFICTFDPFKQGEYQYIFSEKCKDLSLQDGTQKIFFNCTYQGDDISEELRFLYDYIMTGKAESKLTQRIEEAVTKGQRNEVWRTQYMKEWVIIQDARDEGREEGIKEGIKKGQARERVNTERERRRADKAEEELKKLREENLRLRKQRTTN